MNCAVGKDSSILVSAIHSISTFSSIISLRSSNLFLIELMFKYETMILLWLWILRDFNPSNETFGCLWVFWHTLAKGSDFHKEPTNCLKLFAKYDEPRLFRWSFSLLKHDLSMLLLSMKDKPLPLQKRWSFSLTLAISSFKSLSYLLIKLDMTTLGGFCLSYSSISFTSFLIFFTVLISFSISLVPQCMVIASGLWRIQV